MSENPIAIRSKNSIEQALLSLMAERPYRTITIRMIAERANLSRQAFYLNFSDKDAVLIRRLERLFDEIMQRVHEKRVETVESLVSTYSIVVRENARFLKMLADNGLNGLVCGLFSAHLDRLPPVLPCQRDNRTETERRYFNLFWVAAFIEIYAKWLSENMRTDQKEIDRIVTDIMLGAYFRPAEDGSHTAT